MKIKKLTRMAALSALAVVLVLLVRFPLFAAAPFLEYDPGDVPIFIATFLFGPWEGLAVTVIVSIIQGVTVSSGSGIIGIIMHIFATGAFCVAAGYIYKTDKTKNSAVLSLAVGTVIMTAVMALCNYILTPLYTGMPRETVAAMLLPIIIPFNLLKAAINSALTLLIYKPMGRLLRK